MGCAASKPVAQTGLSDDELKKQVDPVTKMNMYQVKIVNKAFQDMDEPTADGCHRFFQSWLRSNPEMLSRFEFVGPLDLNTFLRTSKCSKMAVLVWKWLKEAMKCLVDGQTFIDLVQKVGMFHGGTKVQMKDIECFCKSLNEVLLDRNGGATPELGDALFLLSQVMIANFQEGLSMANNRQFDSYSSISSNRKKAKH